tara:strand:- start:259 stop:591 length:333 start_codon:yes stop_codon:yes gene_type:complete
MKDWILLIVLVAAHGFAVVVNVVGMFILPILPCYMYMLQPSALSLILGTIIAVALISFLIRLSVASDCPFTNYENVLRERLGLRRIGGFIGHYFIKPFRKRRRHHDRTKQ